LIPEAHDISIPSNIEQPLLVPIEFSFNGQTHYDKALLDSGATISTDGLIDSDLAQQLSKKFDLPLKPLAQTRQFVGYDGHPGKPAKHLFFPRMKLFNHEQSSVTLLCTQLGSSKILLGKRWLRQHGMILDLPRSKLLYRKGHCKHVGAPECNYSWQLPNQDEEPVIEPIDELVNKNTPIRILPRSTHRQDINQMMKAMTQELQQEEPEPEPEPELKPQPLPKSQSTYDIAVVSAPAFRMLARRYRQEVFSISMKELQEHQYKKQQDQEIKPEDLLPQEYHEFLDMTTKEASDKLPPHRTYDHKIQLEENQDPRSLGYTGLRHHSPEELEAIRDFVQENFGKDFIRASTAPWAAPPLIVRKPGGGLRMCIDFRKLNNITRKDRYPIPLIEETLARFQGAKIFTRLDIRQAFHRLRMHPDSEELTTFRTRYGTYCYKVLPFGLTNGPASFQRYINDQLMDYLDRFCSAYLDDILIYSKNLKEHRQHVRQVLQRLRKAELQIDLKKCEFHVTETKFLGLIITTEGIRMDPEKVRAIQEWDRPQNLTQVQSFLGFCNFYRRFIQGFAKIAKPLTELTKKGTLFKWLAIHQQAFEELKRIAAQEPMLRHFDRTKEAILEADSSDWALGGVLSQEDDTGILRPFKNSIPS
jgi:hypothetical protein